MASIVTNISASLAQQAMGEATRSVAQSTQQLSTGRRVNSASDDTAGMAMGSRFSAQSISLQRAMRNANEGIAMLQTADGAANGISESLFRMKELAIQAANGTYSDSDRSALNIEFSELRDHISASINNTRWNDQKLLDGTRSTVNLQIGASSGDTQAVEMGDFSSLSVLTSAGISNASDALSSLSAIENSLTAVDATRVKWGAAINRLTHAGNVSSQVALNLDESRSKIIDADYAKATADLAKAQILQMAGKAMLSQANQEPIGVLRLLR